MIKEKRIEQGYNKLYINIIGFSTHEIFDLP